MKNKIILLLIPILMLSLLCSCNKPSESSPPLNEIYEAKHQRDEISSRIFSVYKMETEKAVYEIEKMEGIDSIKAEEIVNDIENLVKKIIAYNEELYITKPTIIVTQYDIKTGVEFEVAYCINSTVVVNFDMLESYDLTYCIVEAMSSIDDHWLLHGITGSVLEITIDQNQLQTYYSNPDNLNTLDFFGMRFMYEFNGEESAYAKHTAIALYKYIKDKNGFNSIVSFNPQIQIKVTKDMKNEWLESIGVNNIYDSMYDGLFNGYRFNKKGDFDITIISSFAEYNIVMQEDERFLLSSIDNVELFLYKNLMGVKELKERLSASKYYDKLKTDELIVYEINESLLWGGGQTPMESGVVELNSIGIEFFHIHETVHSIFHNHDQPTSLFTYLQEGLACYLSSTATSFYTYFTNPVSKEPYYEEHNIISLLHENNANGQTFVKLYDNSQVLEQNLLDYYLSHGGKIGSLEDFNLSLYADAMSYAILKAYEGNLNNVNLYPIYESYVTYLVNTYSLDHVIGANIDVGKFEEIFGKSNEIIFSEWKDYLFEN
ncbi:MAG: hypothetical protein PHY13_01225 [Clostridia bacterium]|nr:hypothetical protein [Clostridia bacterium]MDD4542379.1 hypothetical protein [Clostridia bacterium]